MPDHTPSATWLAGGGEMGVLIRSHPWADTSLGPPESWPQSLRSAVSILLPSKAQIVLFWGPELVAIYNDAYTPTMGTKHPRALGRPARECFSETWEVLGPLFEGVLRTGEAFAATEYPFFLNRQGFLEETYYDVSYDPVRIEDGSVGGIFCIVSDQTGRVVGERRLRTLRELGTRTADVRSASEVCRHAAEVLAAEPRDCPFAVMVLFDMPDDLASVAGVERPPVAPIDRWFDHEAMAAVRDGGIAEADTAAFVERAPEIAADRVLVLPVSSGTQVVGALIAGLSRHLRLSTDYRGFFEMAAARISAAITNARAYEEERRRAEALAELDRAKTTFFSNVSHEFRTPLTLMIGPIEDLLDARRDGGDDEMIAALDVAHRNSLRLLKLVNTLLDFSRLEAGRIEARYEPVDLAAFTSDLASVFRSAMERAGLRLVVECGPLPEPVHVDPDMWEKIVLNLLSNAFKFTFEGTITVALRWRGDHVELSVTDTGIGIPAAELPRVFERFHRVTQARGRTHEGTGIGLALVQELAKLHGGAVRARSEEGRGSEFVVAIRTGTGHLPGERLTSTRELTSTRIAANSFVEEALRWLPGRTDAPRGEMASEGIPEFHRAHPAGSTRPRVLVADDNADMRDYVARILGQAYRVETAKDGQAALARIDADPPALVLADVMMPNMDGFDLLRAIRNDARARSLPVILLSARAGDEARIEGLEAGADEYLVKPFSGRELLVRVASQIELTRVRREGAAAQAHLAAIVDSAQDAIISKDLDGIIQWCNGAAERLFGYSSSELVGRPVRILIPADRQSEEDQILERLRRGERVEHFETVRLAKDGRPIDVALTISPVRDASGTIIGASKIARDIAVIKRAEAERMRLVEEASRLKDEFLASLSHELRTPLNAIVGYARMLRSGILPQDRQPNAIETIERNATSLTQIVEDVLDVSRIVSGKIRLNVQTVDVPDIVARAIEGIVPAADAKGVRLERIVDPHATPIAGDPERLQQILWNLLTNAVKFTPRGGKVQVRLERVDSQVAVTVSDTGIGIPPEFLPHVFERFRQADGGIARERGGLGIGLSIARQLAEMHGGTIDVESAGPGQGATFRLKIPLMIVQPSRDAPSRTRQIARPAAIAGGDLRALHVLAVDDDRDALALLTEVLESAGARVSVASSAEEALGKLDDDVPNVIIADLGMPRMDGFQLIQQIRQHTEPRVRSVPAAALTAYARSEDRTKALRAGFQIHLAKPIDPAELVTTVASLVRRFAGDSGRA